MQRTSSTHHPAAPGEAAPPTAVEAAASARRRASRLARVRSVIRADRHQGAAAGSDPGLRRAANAVRRER